MRYSCYVGIIYVWRGFKPLNPECITLNPEAVPCRNFTPSVIEPSFGIGRILYCMFEHTYYTRKEDEKRTVFAFTPVSAPYKATVFPLLQRAELNAPAEKIAAMLRRAGLSTKIDTTSAPYASSGV